MARKIIIYGNHHLPLNGYSAIWQQDLEEGSRWKRVFAGTSIKKIDDHYIVSLKHITPEESRGSGGYHFASNESVIGVEHDLKKAKDIAYKGLLKAVKSREARRVRTTLVDLVEE